jgi:hypothetical protein
MDALTGWVGCGSIDSVGKFRTSAVLLAATAASAVMLTPGTASAAPDVPIQVNVISVPPANPDDPKDDQVSLKFSHAGVDFQCVNVEKPGSFPLNFKVPIGQFVFFHWSYGPQCAVPLSGYTAVDLQVKNPAPLHNFWIVVTDKTGKQ